MQPLVGLLSSHGVELYTRGPDLCLADVRARRFVRELRAELERDRIGDVAAMLTYYAVFAVVPMTMFVLTLALSGCKQGEGERCQVSSDCQDDLICVLPVGGTPQSGGLCASVTGVDMASTADFAVEADLSVVD